MSQGSLAWSPNARRECGSPQGEEASVAAPCWHHRDGEDTPPSMLHQGSPGLGPSHAGTAAFPAHAGGGDSAVAFVGATVLQEDVDAFLAPRSAGVEERCVPHGIAGLHIRTILWREERVLGRLRHGF